MVEKIIEVCDGEDNVTSGGSFDVEADMEEEISDEVVKLIDAVELMKIICYYFYFSNWNFSKHQLI